MPQLSQPYPYSSKALPVLSDSVQPRLVDWEKAFAHSRASLRSNCSYSICVPAFPRALLFSPLSYNFSFGTSITLKQKNPKGSIYRLRRIRFIRYEPPFYHSPATSTAILCHCASRSGWYCTVLTSFKISSQVHPFSFAARQVSCNSLRTSSGSKEAAAR